MVALRTIHLVAVIALGALLLGAPAAPHWSAGTVAGAVLVSGLAMLVLDMLAHRRYLRTVAGLTGVLKLVLFAILAIAPEPLWFWATVVLSGVVSHAPARVRHRLLVMPRGAGEG